MKALVFGQSGQLATELARRAPAHGVEAHCLSRAQADLQTPETCAQAIAATDADVVINAAAFTGVDAAEADPATAFRINAEAPGAMARACAARDLPFLHVSTDYVFDGTGDQPRSDTARPAPLGVYGRSKLAGERAVADAGGWHVILRTAWVFSAHGSNFVKTMLRLAATQDRLRVVDDQIGGPTPAAALADALWHMAGSRDEPGLFHLSGAPEQSWAGFARAIFAASGHGVAVDPIPSRDYPLPAPRPLNSRLDCSRIARVYGIERPDWQAGLAQVIAELEGCA